MPKGHCRYILLQPEVKGQRCACVSFTLRKGIPGSTCECGHLACFHNQEPEPPTDQRQELEFLKRRIQQLENQLARGHEDVISNVVSRLNEVQEYLERSREEFGEQIKGAYRNVAISWRSIEQVERRNQQQDEQLRQIYSKLQDHDEQLDRLHAGQLELRDADLSLEERFENLTETLEEKGETEEKREEEEEEGENGEEKEEEEEGEEEELPPAAAAAATTPPQRRRSMSDKSRPNLPLSPLGEGAASQDVSRRAPRSPAGGPKKQEPGDDFGRGGNRVALAKWPHPASCPSKGAWTVHISLLPHALVPMPFERNTNAYQRCLSRGLHRMVAVHGCDAAAFRTAVEKAFGRFLRGREWMPLQAKLCDAETLQGLPMLRPLEPHLINPSHYDHDFLRRHCAVCDANGMIDSLYIAMRHHKISWHTLRHSPVFMDGLEDCWAYDPLLDRDPFDGDMAVDDEDRPAAGAITTAIPPLQPPTVAGLKRPFSEVARSNSTSDSSSDSSSDSDSNNGGGSSSSSNRTNNNLKTNTNNGFGSGTTPAGAADEPRVKRSCPLPPPSGPMVEMRRRDIKTA